MRIGVGVRPSDKLSEKEVQIIRLVCLGLKNKEIARALPNPTTEHVVKNYLRVIYDRTGMGNRKELIMFALQHGLGEMSTLSVPRLTEKEVMIIDLACEGVDNKEIGQILNMAYRTVKAHWNRIFMRFGLGGIGSSWKVVNACMSDHIRREKERSYRTCMAPPVVDNAPLAGAAIL